MTRLRVFESRCGTWSAPLNPVSTSTLCSGSAASQGAVFDSDVVIEILRGRVRVVEAAAALEASGVPTFCTAISWAEIFAGIRSGEETHTLAFFEARGEVVLDRQVGHRAGGYLARFAKSHGVEIADALVAATAAVSGLRLWTLNRNHYPMDDLRFFEES